ncbi:peptide chain release factor N(5)-glutamine methyltransferase [Planctomicrobium piriforme]|uniref:Release factor glutamine methyltransferase n=1 Tax=Planctomicrobium piriforme TaxID=1576369 RepID=A0A1I3B102_9PLAN|nr:peptide chain release factor N(5)-glutamine methyltransferase [Planctomicrobium piriforme]SFH55995.1 release factor glutamine methyltransferase [Planctomicrobium piriforme]
MTTEEPWTVRRILDWTIGFLKERGSETPRLDAEVLLAHARKCKRIQLYTQFDQPLTDEQRTVMRELVKRRANAEPVAYLVGHREFFSLDFLVKPGVFIPRPDTEILVVAAIEILKDLPGADVLDLCSGSGCVPIAIAKNQLNAKVMTVELDPNVAAVTQANIDRHQLQDRVTLLQGDLFQPVPGGSQFDVITSNPPYVQQGEIAGLAADIRNHEPHLALDGGADGLDVIRRIVEQSPAKLKSGGWLMFELSPEQAPAALKLVQSQGFVETGVKNDLSGQARVIVGRKAK